jgi:predicted transcriptional regulator
LNDIKHGARPSGRTQRAILGTMKAESAYDGPKPLCNEVCERIRALGPARVAREFQVGRRTIYDMLNGAIPRVRTLKRVMSVIKSGPAVPEEEAA